MKLHAEVTLTIPDTAYGSPTPVVAVSRDLTLTELVGVKSDKLTVDQVHDAIDRLEAGLKELRAAVLAEVRRLLELAETRELEAAEAARADEREARAAMVRPIAG